jgi:hypothetical protein
MEQYIAVIIFIILGIILAFFGRKIMETIAFIIGALLGAAIALWLAPELHERFLSDYLSANMCLLIGVIIGALIGGYLGRSLMYGMISFMVASMISGAVYILTSDPIVTLITFFVTLIIMHFLVRKFLAVITAFLGGCLVGAGIMFIAAGSLGGLSFIVFIIIAGLLTFAGARYQLSNK